MKFKLDKKTIYIIYKVLVSLGLLIFTMSALYPIGALAQLTKKTFQTIDISGLTFVEKFVLFLVSWYIVLGIYNFYFNMYYKAFFKMPEDHIIEYKFLKLKEKYEPK